MNKEENLKRAIDNMEILLEAPSGATSFQLRTAAYYVAATWFLSKFKKFAYLVIYGSTGVGKSDLLEALGKFCKIPVFINISGTTARALRNLFDDANEGSALLEEYADTQYSGEIDQYLNARYSRQTQTMRKLVKVRDNDWEVAKYETFGATVIHRRDHFKDQALENRCIWLHIQTNTNRSRNDYSPIPEYLIEDVVNDLKAASVIDLPDKPDWPTNIAPRVAETYDPILRLAQLIDDKPYLAELNNHIQIADASFRDGQTYEPKTLVVRGLVACLTHTNLTTGDYLDLNKSVEITEICRHLQYNYQHGLVPRQAADSLRELGFSLRQSGGRTKVMGITVPQLAKACQETAIVDELVAKAARSTP
ncbi:hypothetical protein ACFLV6_00230 [Chloroflexota bacterium]